MTGPWDSGPSAKTKKGAWGWWVLAAFAAVLAGVLLLAWIFPDALADRDGQVHLTRSLLFLALVGGSLIVHRRVPAGHMLRNAAIWLAIGGVLLAAYSLKDQAALLGQRMAGEILPFEAMETAPGQVTIRRSSGGHFLARATIDGVSVRFLVDTGASDVVLTQADARRLGFDPGQLTYSRLYRTANGTGTGAPVRLQSLRIGPIIVTDVRASVNGAPMDRSLLGLSFLNRLSEYRVRADEMMLLQ